MSASACARVAPTDSDERLALAAGEGDEAAFETLVRRYRRPLLCYSRRLGVSEARAEDIAQQSLMRAWISLQRGVTVSNVSAWLYRIAHNATIDALRGPAESHEPLTEAATEVPAVDSDPERALIMRGVFAELAALPEMQREALLCTAVEGRSNEQAARALGLSSGAVRGLVYRARATLRAAAGAVAPPSLLGWLSAAGRRAHRLADRAATLQAGGAGAGAATGGLIKAGTALLAAGAIAAGVAVVHRAPAGAGAGRRPRLAPAEIPRRALAARGAGGRASRAASHAPRGGAARGAHARGVLRGGAQVRSPAVAPAGSALPVADGRELASASGGGETSASSSTSPPAGATGAAPRKAGQLKSAPPLAGRHRSTTSPVPAREGAGQGTAGGAGATRTPSAVPLRSGGAEGAGHEAPPEHETSTGGPPAEKPESSTGNGTSVPPRKTAPPQ